MVPVSLNYDRLSSNVKSEQAYPETFGFSSLFHGHLRKVTEIKGLWGKMRVGGSLWVRINIMIWGVELLSSFGILSGVGLDEHPVLCKQAAVDLLD